LTASSPIARFLGLTDTNFVLLDRYRAHFTAGSEALARKFYAYVLNHPATAAVFRDFSPERLERLVQAQAAHARDLLGSRLDRQWMEAMAEVGQRHHRLGVDPAWVAGAYTLYWDHWERAMEDPDIVAAERPALRGSLFRLLMGDLMAQLEGYGKAARETDTDRLAIFNVLLQTLTDPQATEDISGVRLLGGICAGLVRESANVAWSGYFVRETMEDVLIPQCLAGAQREGLRIPKTPGDPAWEALEQQIPVIWEGGNGEAPPWLRPLGRGACEVACFPFGSGDLQAVGIIAVWKSGYFHRVGFSYFLAFAHIGDLVLHLRNQALRDSLTGLPNRQLFSERLVHDREQSRRRERLLGVGIFDLDGFKQVNDSRGHAAGDMLLRQAVERVQGLLRTGDTLARLGGDEFGLLLPDLTRIDDLETICERILEELRRPFVLENEAANISASLGFTIYPLDDGDPETLLRHADTALYAAKGEGKDQCRSHTWAMDAETGHRAAIREQVARALQQDRLLLHYQPIVRLGDATGSLVIGVEALLRMDQGDGRLLFPEGFGDSLDHPRLARDIGRLVLQNAAAQGERWHAQGLPLRVAVNISTRHLLDHRFLADLEETLARHPGLPPDRLEIEVTETAPLQDFERARQALARCNLLGVRVGLDDFGTGNASLTYLQRLPAQTIKIDQGFVRDIVNDPRDLAIVTGVITTARMLGLEVVAEGVETQRHAELLREMSCNLLQGYWIARPMSAAEIPGWVAGYRSTERFSAPVHEDLNEELLKGHTHRVRQFVAALEGRETFPDHVLEADAARHCHLGVWMATEGRKFTNHPDWPAIRRRHEALHQLAREAKDRLDAGRKDEAMAIGKRMDLENAALMAELRSLRWIPAKGGRDLP
jgi:diguanylate cyclase (GGDEF)-like protein